MTPLDQRFAYTSINKKLSYRREAARCLAWNSGFVFRLMLRPSTKFEVRRPSRSEDTAHLVCQLFIHNSFPVIRTTIAKKIVIFTYPGLHFLFALQGTPLRQSRKTLHEWKDNSVLCQPLAACRLGAVHILYNAQQGGRVANNLLYTLYEGWGLY